MNSMRWIPLLFFIISICAYGQEDWKASWITHPRLETGSPSVLHFRNNFTLTAVPEHVSILLSADTRYKLFVNGNYAGQGPANNDLRHYTYDEVNVTRLLRAGNNVIAVEVFSLGKMNPLRYESEGVKLFIQSNGDLSEKINTGTAVWRVLKNTAYTPTYNGKDFKILGYYAMGGGEKIDASKYPWGWNDLNFSDTDWQNASSAGRVQSYGDLYGYGAADQGLSARTIPAMDESPEERPVLRKVTGPSTPELNNSWQNQRTMVIPKSSEVTLLLDQTFLTKGYPYLTFSGGKDATVEVSYAEAMFLPGNVQGNRNEIEGKEFIGLIDIYKMEGGRARQFTTMLPRVWRYIQLKIKTADEPLNFDGFYSRKFIYPFKENAVFKSDIPLLKDIWNVGWRTARLCADETYMDCPYYEQLQYIGDTRIQALISLYVSGDDRLMRNAIDQFAYSITDEGITQSRYPSSSLQYIPPYSLFWINMIHDYHMHRNDDAFTKKYLDKMASILFWFEAKLREDKLLGPMPWWSYVDVTDDFKMSNPPGSWEGGSIVLTLQFVYALDEAIALFNYHKKEMLAEYFKELKSSIQQAINTKAFDPQKEMFADTPERNHFSQHANILAILTDTAPVEKQSTLFQKIISDNTLSKANIYFRFYLTRAAQKTGHGDYFVNNLQVWEKMLKEGLTTFAEHEEKTRSDCHAWSASPNYEFLNTVCGIQPASPHFDEIKIAPSPGNLTSFSGKMPHPKGEIEVSCNLKKGKLSGEVVLPPGTKGVFYWGGKQTNLGAGKNKLSF